MNFVTNLLEALGKILEPRVNEAGIVTITAGGIGNGTGDVLSLTFTC